MMAVREGGPEPGFEYMQNYYFVLDFELEQKKLCVLYVGPSIPFHIWWPNRTVPMSVGR